MKKVFPFGNVDVIHDAHTNTIDIIYKGFTKSSDFRACCEKSIELIKQHKSRKMLIDQRKMGVLSAEDAAWLATSYYPRCYEALKAHMQVALVLPQSAFGEMSSKAILKEFDKTLKTGNAAQMFPSVEEAKVWLLAS